MYLKEISSINKITITSTCKGSKRGGESKGGALAPPTLFLDQTEAQRAQRNFLGDKPTSYLRVWMTASPTPPPLSQSLDPPLTLANFHCLRLPKFKDKLLNKSRYINVIKII